MLAGQPMEMKNPKNKALAKELRPLADELLKESWKNSKGPTVPTPETLMATYARQDITTEIDSHAVVRAVVIAREIDDKK